MGAQAPKATKEEGRGGGDAGLRPKKEEGLRRVITAGERGEASGPQSPSLRREGALSLHPCTPSLPLSTPHHTRSEGTNGRTEEEEEEKEEGGSGGGGGGGGGGRQAAFFLPFPERSLSLFL